MAEQCMLYYSSIENLFYRKAGMIADLIRHGLIRAWHAGDPRDVLVSECHYLTKNKVCHPDAYVSANIANATEWLATR